MDMAKKAVVCVANSLKQSELIISDLRSAGFLDQDISVLLPDKQSSRDFAHEKGTKMPEGAATGAATGGVLGGTLGLLAGIGAIAIPGLGPFIAAGPIMAALSGAGIGAAAGGLTGALVGLGIPEFEAKQYEAKLKGGNMLISVHTEDAAQRSVAKEIFERYDAEDIATVGEKTPRDRGSASERARP
jgi:hypothetical protein